MKVKQVSVGIACQRLTIRSVAPNWLMRRALRRHDNDWTEYTGPLPVGVYAFVSGEWRNVKTLERSILAFV